MTTSQKKELPKLVKLIKKYFWKLVIFNGIVCVIAIVILLLMPAWYSSTAVIMIDKNSSQLDISSVAMGSFGLLGGGFGLNSNEEVLKNIRLLNSRTMKDKVIAEFDLMNTWKIESRSEIYKKLSEDISFIDNEDGSISISCNYKKDPDKAAAIANYYVKELSAAVRDYEDQYKIFVQEAFEKQKLKMTQVEQEYAAFQKSTGIYNLEQQTELSFQALTELEIAKMQSEIQFELIMNNYSEDDPRSKKLVSEIEILSEKIETYKTTNIYSNIPVDKLSEQGADYLRLYRDYLIQEKILQFLSMEKEQAILDEQKKNANFIVIDNAVPSDKRYKPRRTSTLILIMLASALFSMVAVNTKETYF